MPARESTLQVSRDGEFIHAKLLARSIMESGNLKEIREDLLVLIEASDRPMLLISFELVEELSSSGLSMLITINKFIEQKGGQLRLTTFHPHVYELFTITNLDKVFRIYQDVADAKASLA